MNAHLKIREIVPKMPDNSIWEFSSHPATSGPGHTQGNPKHEYGANRDDQSMWQTKFLMERVLSHHWATDCVTKQHDEMQMARVLWHHYLVHPSVANVNHESVSHRHNCLYSPLCTTILMLGTHSQKCLWLMFTSTIILELSRTKDSIVTVVPLHHCITQLIQPLLKLFLGTESLNSAKGDLMLNRNSSRSCLIKEGTPLKAFVLTSRP